MSVCLHSGAVRDYEMPALTPSAAYDVVVAFVESPGQFYCQLTPSQPHLDALMDDIAAHCSDGGGPAGRKFGLGEPLLARYSEDDGWYRAKVTGQWGGGGAAAPRQASSRCRSKTIFFNVFVRSILCTHVRVVGRAVIAN